MSALLAVVSAAPVAAPVAHSAVAEVVKTVQVYHTQLIAGTQALLALASGAGVGVLHRLVERDRLSKQANLVLVQAYTVALTLLTMFVTGDLNSQTSVSAIVAQYGLVLGGNQALYQLLYLYNSAAGNKKPAVDNGSGSPSPEPVQTAVPADLPISTNP